MLFLSCQTRIVTSPRRTGEDVMGDTSIATAPVGEGANYPVQEFSFGLVFSELQFSHLSNGFSNETYLQGARKGSRQNVYEWAIMFFFFFYQICIIIPEGSLGKKFPPFFWNSVHGLAFGN